MKKIRLNIFAVTAKFVLAAGSGFVFSQRRFRAGAGKHG